MPGASASSSADEAHAEEITAIEHDHGSRSRHERAGTRGPAYPWETKEAVLIVAANALAPAGQASRRTAAFPLVWDKRRHDLARHRIAIVAP